VEATEAAAQSEVAANLEPIDVMEDPHAAFDDIPFAARDVREERGDVAAANLRRRAATLTAA